MIGTDNYIAAFFLLALAGAQVSAQVSGKRNSKPVVVKQAPAVDLRKQAAERAAKIRADLIEASRLYRKSLDELMVYRERGVLQAEEQVKKLKELFALGIVSKKQVQDGESALAEARARAEETRQQMRASEGLIAQTLEESKLAEQLEKTPLAKGGLIQTVAYIRFNGATNWSVGNASQVTNFFLGKFGRVLPVSAFGQTALHNQMGFDHRNAMDVAIHPDSVEGQTLLNFLRQAGIPFIAFRQAVAGSATGPHIHIGRPSHRTARP